MTNYLTRSDLLLKQMRVKRFMLAKPERLLGFTNAPLDPEKKFIIVCDDEIIINDVISDILATFDLNKEQLLIIDQKTFLEKNINHTPILCFIGKMGNKAVEKSQDFATLILDDFNYQTSHFKRYLWQQISYIL